MRDLLDAAWGDFPTHDVGLDWSRYTGSARPTSEWCAAVVQHSELTFIQETISTRSQQGFQAGVYDCQFAESRARQVHPGCRGMIVAVSDGNYADDWDASEYGRGWASVASMNFLPYGTPSICASFCFGAGSSPFNLYGDMVPETWGTTRAPMRRLITQTVGASPIPNTDYDIVVAPYYNTTASFTPPLKEEHDDMISVQFKKDVDTHMWVDGQGQIIARSWDSGAPGPVAAIPVRGDFTYRAIDNKPLVETGYGVIVVFALEGNREAMVTETIYGPIIDIV